MFNIITAKRYKCTRCGHVTIQETNHYGPTWSAGHWNTCPMCPPWAKFAEFGGTTTWECLDKEPGMPRTIESVDDIDDNSRHDTMAVLSTVHNMGQEHLIEGCRKARHMLFTLWEGFYDAFGDESKAWDAIAEELNHWINIDDNKLEFLNKDRMKDWRPSHGETQTC